MGRDTDDRAKASRLTVALRRELRHPTPRRRPPAEADERQPPFRPPAPRPAGANTRDPCLWDKRGEPCGFARSFPQRVGTSRTWTPGELVHVRDRPTVEAEDRALFITCGTLLGTFGVHRRGDNLWTAAPGPAR